MSRALGALALALLGLAAAVQVNDPDPLRWGLFYGLGAVVGLLAALGRLWWKHAAGYVALAAGVGVMHLIMGSEGLNAQWIEHETVREGLGALLAATLVAPLAWLRRREAPDQASPYIGTR